MVLGPVPNIRAFKNFGLSKVISLLYSNEMADGWGLLDSFKMETSKQKDQDMISGLELSDLTHSHPLQKKKGL